MSFEKPTFESKKESTLKPVVEVELGYETFIPDEFREDPIGYFERKGQNIKSGEIKWDENGKVREDPTAVKELPVWTDSNGNDLQVIGKKVNIEKGEIGKSGDPFYEYKVMEIVRRIGLPAPRPVAKAEAQNTHLIVMEKVEGIGWYQKSALRLKENGYSDNDIEDLKREAEMQMDMLRQRFEEAGISRGWKLKDMIFSVDVENRRITNIVPTDWERTKIDHNALERYKQGKSNTQDL